MIARAGVALAVLPFAFALTWIALHMNALTCGQGFMFRLDPEGAFPPFPPPLRRQAGAFTPPRVASRGSSWPSTYATIIRVPLGEETPRLQAKPLGGA
jgi:hypothetical protein